MTTKMMRKEGAVLGRKAMAFLASLALALSLLPATALSAWADEPTVKGAKLSATPAKVVSSSEAQEVVLSLDLDIENGETAAAYEVMFRVASLPQGWQVAEVEAPEGTTFIAHGEDGYYAWVSSGLESVAVSNLAKIRLTVPANTAAGDHQVVLDSVMVSKSGNDFYPGLGEADIANTVTGTVTVEAAEPTLTGATVSLSPEKLTVSGKDQTVIATIDPVIANGTSIPNALQFVFRVSGLPEGWSMGWNEVPEAAQEDYDIVSNGISYWTSMKAFEVSELGSLKVTVPANTPAGEYTVTLEDARLDCKYAKKYEIGDVSFTITVEGEPVPTISATQVDAAEGYVAFEYRISNNPGFTGYGIVLDYDKEALELAEVKAGALSTGGFFVANPATGKVTFAAMTPVTGDGVLFTAIFKVNKSADEYVVTPSVRMSGLDAAGAKQPVDVTVPGAAYAVNVAECTGGTVTAEPATTAAGETVTLTATPDAGYELESLEVEDMDGYAVAVTDGSFVMPTSSVTVTATFAKKPTVTGVTLSATPATVTSSSEAQVVEISLDLDIENGKAVPCSTAAFKVSVSGGLAFEVVAPDGSTVPLKGRYYRWSFDEPMTVSNLGTIRVTVPAGAEPGDYKVDVSRVTASGQGATDSGVTTFLSSASASAKITVEAPAVLLGDVDGDGFIYANDAMLILQYSTGALGEDALAKFNLAAADVDGDGYVYANDAMLVLQYSSGAIEEFPIEKQ